MKKFEQAKRLYKTMIDEYSVHSNTKVFISGITSDFDRLFELFLSFRLMQIQMGMDHRHRDVVISCRGILKDVDIRCLLMPTLDTFFHQSA